jgi:hypothetical protein
MASILNYQTGEYITQGLQGSNSCDEAIQMATRMANERQEPVVLDDDDGQWVVNPDGSVEESGGAY